MLLHWEGGEGTQFSPQRSSRYFGGDDYDDDVNDDDDGEADGDGDDVGDGDGDGDADGDADVPLTVIYQPPLH